MDLHVKGFRLSPSRRFAFLLRGLAIASILACGARAQEAPPAPDSAASAASPTDPAASSSPAGPPVQTFDAVVEESKLTVCTLALQKWPPVSDPRELSADDVTVSRLVFEPLFNVVAGHVEYDDSPITALKVLSDMAQYRDGHQTLTFSDGTQTKPESVLEINLRDGVKFPDGTPLDVEVVKASIARLNEKAKAHLPPDLKIEVQPGRGRQVRILLSRPWGPYVTLLATPLAAMARQDSDGRWMGTGRWRFAPPAEKVEHVDLVPNPAWRGEAPVFGKLRLIQAPGETALVLGLAAGEIDATDAVTPEIRKLFEVRRGFDVDLRPGRSSVTMMFNTRDRWLRFPRFKQGIIKGVAPASLGELFPGQCWQPARGVFPPQMVPPGDRAYRFEPDHFEGRNLLRLEGVDRQGLVLRVALLEGGGGTPLDVAAVEKQLNTSLGELDLAAALAPIARVTGQGIEPPQVIVMPMTVPWHDAHWLVQAILAHHGKEFELPGLEDKALLSHLTRAEHLLSMPGRQFFYRELADRAYAQFSFTLLGFTQVGWIHSSSLNAVVRPDGSLQL